MPFAIYRHEKIKTAQALTASANHMTRATDTPNADPQRAALNRVLIGSADPADAAALIPAPDAVDQDGKKRRRSNSVLAIEILLTASPEWWSEATPAAAGLAGPFDGMAGPRVWPREHRPLAPPWRRADAHLTGFIVPLDEAGHLNARKIGGAARCRQQQTDYAAAVAPLGLSRHRGQHRPA